MAAAHAAWLGRAAGRAFAPPDPGAHLLQGALTGLLGAVRQFTLRRAAAGRVHGSLITCLWRVANTMTRLFRDKMVNIAAVRAQETVHRAAEDVPRRARGQMPMLVRSCLCPGSEAGGADVGRRRGGACLQATPRLLLQGWHSGV